ncbi:hypothetical protein N1851_029417 [Merluccius polli]|uniref:Uncharacterized protein n=1 Tax=Merluccius polli TaxID=89951 RepID=A0AA47M725_MERPO|nr:hypothetical protein N1851_029417 [Merluccius polli]
MDEHYKKNESMSGKHQHHQRRHGKNGCQPKTGLSSPTVGNCCRVSSLCGHAVLEFGRMLPGKADVFNRKWEAIIVPNILKISTASEPSGLPPVPENDGMMIFCQAASCYKALQKLIQLLPPGRGKGYGKCSVKSALANLLDIKPVGLFPLCTFMMGLVDICRRMYYYLHSRFSLYAHYASCVGPRRLIKAPPPVSTSVKLATGSL